MRKLILAILFLIPLQLGAGDNPWYLQSKLKPGQRLEYTLTNGLDIDRDTYKPVYQFVEDHRGNHTFGIENPQDQSFQYMLSSAWSDGAVYNNAKDFSDYIIRTSLEYNNPIQTRFVQKQERSKNKHVQ